MNYSIIIPVFNKAAFTKHCLDSLQATLVGAGEGEVIVVDNASSDTTSEILAQYPWIRVIRNEINRGFAAANNQAAQIARGDALVLLNNDTQAMPGWLAAMLRVLAEPDVGVVGARLLFADGTIQHSGVYVDGVFLGRGSFIPRHDGIQLHGNDPVALQRRDVQIVTGACLATSRALYLELGGLDEEYWNGYEDVDYCLKVGARGLRVVYEPKAALYHFESRSGVQRFRRTHWNLERLSKRWSGKVNFDRNEQRLRRGFFGPIQTPSPLPEVAVLVHGIEPANGRAAFLERLEANVVPISQVAWETTSAADAQRSARELMERRGNRVLVFVHGAAKMESNWLDHLLGQVENAPNCAAATAAPELSLHPNVRTLAADARCTLLALRRFPQHIRMREFDTLDGAVADLLVRALDELHLGTHGAARRIAALPPATQDAAFEKTYGYALHDVLSERLEAVESIVAARTRRPRGLASIVTLSWNAVYFTKLALASIASHTSEPYEVIVVDNGSGQETLEALREIDDPHVRVIYNPTNLGYAGGNNVGLAAAKGDHIVILNNDVIVTEGWLDGLLDAFDRIPGLGISAPRSNRVAGDQMLTDVTYNDLDGIHAYARDRRQRWEGCGYFSERAIGLCLCVDRRVIDEIGGFDERFGLGNFEDDDFCIRVRAAGYRIFVRDDVFIHHFGSQSFAANGVDYRATMAENWRKFAQKWGYPQPTAENGYDPRVASARGFDRAQHFVQLAAPVEESPPSTARVAFVATVRSDDGWQDLSQFVKQYVRAFDADGGTLLAIAALATPDASMIGTRIERIIGRLGLDADMIADIEVSDTDDEATWRAGINAEHVVDVGLLDARSPSTLRRRFAPGVSA